MSYAVIGYEGDLWVKDDLSRVVWRWENEPGALRESPLGSRVFTSLDEAKAAKGPVTVEVRREIAPAVTPSGIVLAPAPGVATTQQGPNWLLWGGLALGAYLLLSGGKK